jgi:hypothetical protein
MFNNFFSEARAVYEIRLKNMVQPGRPQMTTQRMRFACWIPKATNTPSEYVIWLHSHSKNCFARAPQCHVMRALPVLFKIRFILRLLENAT